MSDQPDRLEDGGIHRCAPASGQSPEGGESSTGRRRLDGRPAIGCGSRDAPRTIDPMTHPPARPADLASRSPTRRLPEAP